MIQLSELTIERVQVRVSAPADPTAAAAYWAFPQQDVAPSTWEAGSWQGVAPGPGGYRATTLSPTVGAAAAAVPLGPGDYDVWIQVAAGPDSPVRHVGTLRILAAA